MKKEFFTAAKVYVSTWILIVLLFLSLSLRADISFKKSVETLIEVLPNTVFLVSTHIAFSIFYILFLLIRYFIRIYRRKGFIIMGKQVLFGVVIPFFVLLGIYKAIIYTNSAEEFSYKWDYSIENASNTTNDLYKIDGKHRGMSVFGWGSQNKKSITTLVKNNVEWVAVIPFLYQKDQHTIQMNTPKVIGQWSKRDSVFINSIAQLRAKGVHVHLKPHLWMSEGWRSDISLPSATDWDIWFDSYRSNMIHYARMAQKTGVELFCIGTELRSSLQHQPDRWKALVQEIKTIYHGKLTYAANWDGEFKHVDFWQELDYIGIQAYFPLTKKSHPDLVTLKKGWSTHITTLEALSRTHQRPILFTEVGYKSEASAAIQPWEWQSSLGILYQKKSDRTQQLAYQALFESLWSKEWFSGMYIWQWDTRTSIDSAPTSLDFSPRYKPAQNTIAKGYARQNIHKN
ncbi:hypothetical protein IWQ47_001271 [Aquimarina sp. EL_43]|uniref:glycoside hydrolase family 113 n=1 Tax=unclassified Aquimarina TaxID=2627091 RepID=UPI0018C9945C|nr:MULTISPECIES: hypothetical protein [unclassified Aquimarina]MBG6129426.1 hypothetical protein [Aquimarina sp. EL_35]MBG6150491.1 hypothetical protein [Aquimarina sp. EL_32]MBG6168201.1 hypothetical protein [Aquimarina sp. EL_43]